MLMECENCSSEIRSKKCEACREKVPTWSKYCPLCGVVMPEKTTKRDGDPMSMENRVLCYDGNCIGILDADNRCTICGKGD